MIDAQAALAAANAALQTVADAFAEQSVTLSKLSLERDALSEANIALQAQLDTANATITSLKARLPKTVEDYGAKGDGLTDCTVAIQNAINAGDGRVPKGRWLINPLRVASGTSFYGVMVGAGQKLEADPEAVFVVKANSGPRYCAIRVDGGRFTGGQVQGDRLVHTYTPGSTHEWGYGVQLRGVGSYVADVRISRCTGDGIGVSGTDQVVDRVVSTENRRQGISVFGCNNVRVVDSEFTHTGALEGQAGTDPRCGVDIEPDAGSPWCDGVVFERCKITGNDVSAVVGLIRSEVPGGIRGLRLIDCEIQGVNGVHMKAVTGSVEASVENCRIKRGIGSGIRVEAGATVKVSGNTFSTPTTRTAFELTGTDIRTKYDIYTPSTSPGLVDVGTNRYV